MRERGRKNGPNDLTRRRTLDCIYRQRSCSVGDDTGLTCPTCGKTGLKNVKLHQTKAKCGANLTQPDTSNTARRKTTQLPHTSPLVGRPEQIHSASKATGKRHHHVRKNRNQADTQCSDISVKEYINLPKPSDKDTWKSLDNQLYEELPVCMSGSTPCEQLDNLEHHVYETLLTKFGVKEKPAFKKVKQNNSHQLKRLLMLKKQAKREFKKATKTGNHATAKQLKHDFHKLIRIHNKVRKLELEKQQKQSRSVTYSRFRKNPHQFAKELFANKDDRTPSFEKKDAEKYFTSTYSDKKREYKYNPLRGSKRPPAPEIPFNTKPPTIGELRSYLNKRKNACSPGTNRIPFLVWKKCPMTVTLLHDVLCQIWKGSNIPTSWRVGETILISKTEDTSDPANFRPITLKNSSGNLFMGILAQRCIRFLTDNKYINTSLQKGFMEKMAGCIEHTEALTEILQNAKKNGNSIATTWLDLQNAYGSVPHNLIQYALEWYHVPESIRKIVFNYYDESYIRVKTNDWTTKWIHCGIGVFQGCPLSCILFLAVFNLCLDLLQKHANLGYHMKGTQLTTVAMAYADDLTIIAKNPKDCQKLIDVVDTFLKWTRTMKAKPIKCKSHAMKKFVPNNKQRQEGQKTHYSPYDPELKINGEDICYINSQPMKFLGKLIYKDLKDEEIRLQVKKKLTDMLTTTDRCQLNGVMKLWIYNNAIIPRLSWEFTIYNFPMSFAESLEAVCTKYLKKWAGICRSITTSALYRSRDNFGLQLKRLTTTMKCFQVTKYHLNKYSKDKTTKQMYSESMFSKHQLSRWNGVKELEERERHLLINEMCRGQHDRAGIGFHRHQKLIKAMDPSEHRKCLSGLIKDLDEHDMITFLHSCAKQGQFLKWDTAMQVDTSWNKLLYVWSPELLSFHINAIHDLLPSPANLRLWGKTDTGQCQLCHHNNCTLFHILNGCTYSLHEGRYNWRHDHTLKTIADGVLPFIDDANNQSNHECENRRHIVKAPQFKTAKGKSYSNPDLLLVKDDSTNILKESNDWVLLMDEEFKQMTFPPQICETSKRPDITIYSQKTHTVIIIELTVPTEENLANAYARKKCKYDQLVADCEFRGWKTHYFPVEVGSRGFYNTSLTKCLKALGIPRGKRKPILDTASRTAMRASYYIWLNRRNHHMHRCDLTQNVQREERRLSAHETGLTHRSLVRSPETSVSPNDRTGLKESARTTIPDEDAHSCRMTMSTSTNSRLNLKESARKTTPDEDEQTGADVYGHPITTASHTADEDVTTNITRPHRSQPYKMKTVNIPHDLVQQFSRVANTNTLHNIETCGILSGKPNCGELQITHLLIPKQSGTANSCSAEREEDILDYQLRSELVTLGWIHTHPSQTAFLSSVDLHTQLSYQLLMPEAIAIVYSATFKETGCYHLTTNYGLNSIRDCHQTGFHPHHMELPLFETATHTTVDQEANITLVDLRCE